MSPLEFMLSRSNLPSILTSFNWPGKMGLSMGDQFHTTPYLLNLITQTANGRWLWVSEWWIWIKDLVEAFWIKTQPCTQKGTCCYLLVLSNISFSFGFIQDSVFLYSMITTEAPVRKLKIFYVYALCSFVSDTCNSISLN